MSNNGLTIDQIVIRKALRHEKGLWSINEHGVRREYLQSDGRKGWDFIETYQAKNDGQRPGDEVLVFEMGWPKVRFEDLPDMTISHVCNIILGRTIENISLRSLANIETTFAQKGNESRFEAREQILHLAEELKEVDTVSQAAVELMSLYPDVGVNYELYKQGKLGASTPWPTITKHIAGYQDGHVVYFVARPKTGKTWVLLYNCLHLFNEGQKVLLVSPELTHIEAAERMACIHLEIPYEMFTDGQLGNAHEARLKAGIEDFQDRKGFKILDKKGLSKQQIESAIDQYDPDVLAVDSMYKVGEGYNTKEKISDAADWLSRVVERGRPRKGFATSQMNRDAISAETTVMENIYGSDAIGQDAHLIYGLFQDHQMRKDNQIGWKQLAVRRGKWHPPFFANIDLISMNFGEINESAYDRDEDDDMKTDDEFEILY